MESRKIAYVASAIRDLTYREMMSVANGLLDMNNDYPRELDKEEGWAELLSSWAESHNPENAGA